MIKYKLNRLQVDGVSVEKLARSYGTPLYVYSGDIIVDNFRKFDRAFSHVPHLICYALKANSNLSIARILRQAGAGTDIVSGGELYRALKAGFEPQKIVFSGVGKTADEMRFALRTGILTFNVESLEELQALNRVAKSLRKKAPVSIRINPDVAAGGHHHITTGTSENKFGIFKKYLFEAYGLARSLSHLEIKGLQAHIGSQITTVAPFETLLKALLGYVDQLGDQGIRIRYLDVGGGLGISYEKETPPTPKDLSKVFKPHLKGRDLTLLFEPGRFLVGESGILVTQVLYRKKTLHKTFVIVDAAMNDLARPALYDAYHHIVPVTKKLRRKEIVDIVGPVCESGDYFAKARSIGYPEQGEFMAIENAGAYGFAMSSQYNSRPRAAEILVENHRAKLVRKRETLEDLIRGEK